MFQAEETLYAKAESLETPLPIAGIKREMGAQGHRVKWQEMKLWKWAGPECEGPIKEFGLYPTNYENDQMVIADSVSWSLFREVYFSPLGSPR